MSKSCMDSWQSQFDILQISREISYYCYYLILRKDGTGDYRYQSTNYINDVPQLGSLIQVNVNDSSHSSIFTGIPFCPLLINNY